jgi:transcriptional regulator with XRE-family HTH domain
METPDEMVAHNVARIRGERRLTVRDVSARLTEIGHPILPSGVNKLENGNRRVDVGDLLALAFVLRVSPLTLLLPAQPQRVQLAPKLAVAWQDAWRWATGEQPVVASEEEVIGPTLISPEIVAWIRENRPHEADNVVDAVARFMLVRLSGKPFTLSMKYEGAPSAVVDANLTMKGSGDG